ncbi:hypothetical protein QTP86_008274 [Hemibagrus guttatus]|nr:hypothetical protein QTP86_008274 [Hemibagrus guttatus]
MSSGPTAFPLFILFKAFLTSSFLILSTFCSTEFTPSTLFSLSFSSFISSSKYSFHLLCTLSSLVTLDDSVTLINHVVHSVQVQSSVRILGTAVISEKFISSCLALFDDIMQQKAQEEMKSQYLSKVSFVFCKSFKSSYRPLVRRSKPVLKQVKTWPAGAISALQDCFECTDWNMFRETATNSDSINLEEYTTSVTSYNGKCIDDVTVSKTITTRSKQKPWMTAEVRALLKSRDSAFRAGDKEALRTPRAKLSRAIKEVKRTHAQRIHGHFQDSRDSRRMWQGIQAITNY